MQITAPEHMPAPGLTIPIAEAQLVKNSILTRTRCGYSMTVVPVNAFPRGDDYSRATRAAINALLKQATNLSLTIPTPTSRQHPNWIKQMGSGSPKPGWIWLSDTETINEHLAQMPDVQCHPPYPTRSHQVPLSRPRTRPSNQITMICRVMHYDTQDIARCMGSDDHELPIAMIDCYQIPRWADMCDSIVHASAKVYTAEIPPGQSISDWLDDLKNSRPMAGWLWRKPNSTLNDWLVSRGFATRAPK